MAAFVARRPLLVALTAIALIVTLAFAGRAAWRLGHRLVGPPPPPRQVDVSAIEGWMTVPYVGRAYRVPPPELFRALDIPERGHRTSTLDDIARETGRTPSAVIDTVRREVAAWQEAHPPPKPDAPKPEPRSE